VSKLTEGVYDRDPVNLVARRVLLESLEALQDQADAITIVGAQAVYLRSVDTELTVASFTSDADLNIDPTHLAHMPLIEEAMSAAGFIHLGEPGQWVKNEPVGNTRADIAVDLLVPQRFAGRRGRAVSMPPHGGKAARQVDGLEAAVLDFDVMDVASLESDDPRVLSARVAGPAALLVAKAYKIAQRAGEPNRYRLDNKDAGDVIRLMLATDEDEVAARFDMLLASERTAEVTVKGLASLRELFGAARTTGTLMAVDALAGDPIETQVPLIGPAYVQALPRPAT
jgi:hypothetical protein